VETDTTNILGPAWVGHFLGITLEIKGDTWLSVSGFDGCCTIGRADFEW